MYDESDKDQLIRCCDCPNDFVFTEGEKKFYAERGLSTPKRCKDCRIAKREQHKK